MSHFMQKVVEEKGLTAAKSKRRADLEDHGFLKDAPKPRNMAEMGVAAASKSLPSPEEDPSKNPKTRPSRGRRKGDTLLYSPV